MAHIAVTSNEAQGLQALKLKLPMTWVLHQKLLMSSLVNEFVDHLISGTLAEITKNI
jgi:hypothetical protein